MKNAAKQPLNQLHKAKKAFTLLRFGGNGRKMWSKVDFKGEKDLQNWHARRCMQLEFSL